MDQGKNMASKVPDVTFTPARVLSNWRYSKWFFWGYYPFRLVFWLLAVVFRLAFVGAATMCWLQPETGREILRRTR